MEFLFENPIAWIILAGILSSLFKRKKPDEHEQQKPIRRTNESKPAPKSSNPFDEIKEVLREVNRTFQEEIQKPTKEITQAKQVEVKEMVHTIDEQKLEYEKITTPESEVLRTVSKPPQPKKHNLQVDESKLVDAVIWPEILGPPRAKNPYMKSRMRNKY